jgi:hypothetical protein
MKSRTWMWTIAVCLCAALAMTLQLSAQDNVQPNAQPNAKTDQPINGNGTAHFLPIFKGRYSIGNSQLFQHRGVGFFPDRISLLGLGTTNPQGTLQLDVSGTSDKESLILGNCTVACVYLLDSPFGGVLATTGNLVLDSSGQVLVFNAEKKPEATFGIGVDDATNILTIKQNSDTDPIADAWTTYSSRRWKTNIEPINGALDKVERLRGVSFNWKASGKSDIGLVAEEVGQVVPEVVVFEKNGEDAKSVDYGRLTALLVEAVKDQQNEIKELSAQVEKLCRTRLQPQ